MESKRKKPNKLITLRTQLRILLCLGVGLAVIFGVLFYLSRQASYVGALSAPLYDSRTDEQAALSKLGTGKATLSTKSDETDFKVKLVFSGISSTDVMWTILD